MYFMDQLDKNLVHIFTQAQTKIDIIFFEALKLWDYAKAKIMLSKIKVISEELKTKYSERLYIKAYSSYMNWYNTSSHTLWGDKLNLDSVDINKSENVIIELQNIWEGMSVSHINSVKALIETSSGPAFASIDWVSKNIRITMAKWAQSQIRNDIAVWIAMWISNESQKQSVLKIFWKNKSVWLFRDSLWRKWNAKTYAENLVRTETARAYNLWTVNRWLELWHTKYQVIELPWCCELCATHNGKVYDFAKQWYIELPPYHNCCRWITKIYFWKKGA